MRNATNTNGMKTVDVIYQIEGTSSSYDFVGLTRTEIEKCIYANFDCSRYVAKNSSYHFVVNGVGV